MCVGDWIGLDSYEYMCIDGWMDGWIRLSYVWCKEVWGDRGIEEGDRGIEEGDEGDG